MSSIATSSQNGNVAAEAPSSERLSESEQKMVARLLSDPTYFPVEFRTWLKSWIEGSGIVLPASTIAGGGQGPRTGLPPGLILPVAAGNVPPDVLVCDGRALVRTDYFPLYQAIGVAWGAGDGTTTFNIPDLRDRALYGAGGIVGFAGTDGVAFGSRGGPNHHHDISQSTSSVGDHSHGWSGSVAGVGDHQHFSADAGTTPFALASGTTIVVNSSSGTARYLVTNYQGGTSQAGAHSHSVSGSVGNAGAHGHTLSGPTNGGFGLVPSYAGVTYGITTG